MNNSMHPRVVLNDEGQVFRTSANDEWTYVHLRSEQRSIVGRGVQKVIKTVNIPVPAAEVEDYKDLFPEGKALPGKLVIVESFEASYDGHEAKINPRTNEPFLIDGQPVYRDVYYTDNLNEPDVRLRKTAKATVEEPQVADAE